MDQHTSMERLQNRIDALETEVARMYAVFSTQQAPLDEQIRKKHYDVMHEERSNTGGDCIIP